MFAAKRMSAAARRGGGSPHLWEARAALDLASPFLLAPGERAGGAEGTEREERTRAESDRMR
jgi:hypothetical protein